MSGPRWPLDAGWEVACAPAETSPADNGWEAGLVWQPLGRLQTAGAWLSAQAPVPGRDLDAETWCWRLRFDRPDGLHPLAVLGFDGLATCCRVSLNGTTLLDSDNMFVAHRMPVGPLLRERDNELRVTAWPLAPRLAQRRPRPAWRVPMLRQQQLRWWRTTLLGRTPGWSPSVPPVGPWRPVWLAHPEALLAEQLRLRPRVEGCAGILDATLPTDGQPGDETLTLELSRNGQSHRVRMARHGDGSAAASLRIDTVDRWWPHTHGEPALYEATLWVGEGAAARPWPLRPVGFREVAWDDGPDSTGLRINGVPVFARGACWTPLNLLNPPSGDASCAAAVHTVREAGMNLLRVSGAMWYESEAFHTACDRAGVMVWQDFMFANMDYPADDDAFLASVRQEVTQQLHRWQSSPSLVMVCGNSEVEQQAAMMGAPRDRWLPPLFHAELPAWCAQVLPDVPYWPSSAHGGAWPFSPSTGTSSYYGVGAYQRPLSDARDSGLRFATECLAFSQVPEPAALDRLPGGGQALRVHHAAWKQGAPRDLGAGWDFEDVRDHYLTTLLGVDALALRRHDHERYLMLSRCVVARVVEAAFSQWRAAGSTCRGALVWFLRDLQPGAGWGYLDDAGAPKSAWYALQRVLQPLTVLLTDEGLNGVAMHLVNEGAAAVEARWQVSLYQGQRCIEQVSQPCTLAPRETRRLDVAALLPQFIDLAWAYRFGPPPCDLIQARLLAPDGHVLARAHHLPAGWPTALDDTGSLRIRALRTPEHALSVDVQSDRLALGVHLEVAGWLPEDNWFDLAPGEQRRIRLRPHGAAPRAWRASAQAANHRWPVTVAEPAEAGA